MRRRRGTVWLSIVGGLAVVLALINIVLAEANKRVQTDVSARNQLLQQRAQLDGLTRELVSAMANLAAQRNDEALRAILTEHGITVNPSPSAPAPSAPARRR